MSGISLVPAIDISATGLHAENIRMEVVANNVANAETTRGEDGNIFQRREVVFSAKLDEAMGFDRQRLPFRGVEVTEIVEDQRPAQRVYRPGHPDADEDGFVAMPNVNPIEEMVDMMTASRAYEANLAAIRTAKEMATRALDIGK